MLSIVHTILTTCLRRNVRFSTGGVILAILLISCNTPPAQSNVVTPVTRASTTPTQNTITPTVPLPTATPLATPPTPQRYTSRVLLSGTSSRPDDLIFDKQGHILFSDSHNGTISRLNADGSVTVLLRGLAAPEGIVVLADGTLLIAEQTYNRILSWKSGAPSVLRVLPGTPSTAHCKDGVDGIALDSRTNTLIVPDSPTGEVYRMSLDGKTLTLLASGIVRPVGATVDQNGNIYIADECGGALWRLEPNGHNTRFGNFGMLDDVVLDASGNVLVVDLDPAIHALIRMNLATEMHQVLASRGYVEPQGLFIDAHGNIFVADDFANIIVEYTPV